MPVISIDPMGAILSSLLHSEFRPPPASHTTVASTLDFSMLSMSHWIACGVNLLNTAYRGKAIFCVTPRKESALITRSGYFWPVSVSSMSGQLPAEIEAVSIVEPSGKGHAIMGADGMALLLDSVSAGEYVVCSDPPATMGFVLKTIKRDLISTMTSASLLFGTVFPSVDFSMPITATSLMIGNNKPRITAAYIQATLKPGIDPESPEGLPPELSALDLLTRT